MKFTQVKGRPPTKPGEYRWRIAQVRHGAQREYALFKDEWYYRNGIAALRQTAPLPLFQLQDHCKALGIDADKGWSEPKPTVIMEGE